MAKVKFELNKSGVGELLKSAMLSSHLKAIATQKTSGTTGNYSANVRYTKQRCYIAIAPSDKRTYYRNLKNNELVKAVGV